MIKNYFKIAWRSLVRQPMYSIINISGLAVGLAVCMLIMLYTAHEHSYDRFHKNAGRIFKLVGQMKVDGNTFGLPTQSFVTGPIVKQAAPAIENYLRTINYFEPVVVSNPEHPDKKFSERNFYFTDAGFFNFFSFKLLSGQAKNVLTDPYAIVISEDMAKKYFGGENPVGKTLVIKTDSAYTYHVTGVAENAPSNSSIAYNFVAADEGFAKTKGAQKYLGGQTISNGTVDTWLLVKNAADTTAAIRGLNKLADNKPGEPRLTFNLAPITDTHLVYGVGDISAIKYLTVFPIVAVLVLMLALVNYISLSTARASLRAKEIGVRKVAGASRKNVAMQFYIESGMFAAISFVLGYLLCYAFKPVFLNVLQLKIDDAFLYSPMVLLLMGGLLLVTILVAGSYPSLVLSAFKPAATLKGKMSRQTGGTLVRKVFTTLQFTISVGLIVCGIIIDRQLYFFRHADTGIDKENVVMIPVANTMKDYPAFSQDIKNLAGVSGAATSRYGMFSFYDMYEVDGKTKADAVMLPSLAVGKDFFSVLGLKWKYAPVDLNQLDAGRKVVINETAIETLHLPADPVGSFIKMSPQDVQVAGVIKNFNFQSMANAIKPLGLFMAPDTSRFWTRVGCDLFVRIKPHTNLPDMLASMQNVYKKYDTGTPFDYTFMDDAFNAQYKAEDKLASIFSIFTIITIILASMGLFGLAAFTIEQRTKEISIRKVLGASIASINALLSRDFLKLVLLSIFIGSPIAYYIMHNWLQGFAYRIPIQWWMFAGAGLLAVVAALATVSYHALKAAVTNPVNSLKSE